MLHEIEPAELTILGRNLPYPYIQGKGGIPFTELMLRASRGEAHGFFKGGSGRTLQYEIGKDRVCIDDATNPRFGMVSRCDFMGVAAFALDTRAGNKHHPDMYAKRFIGFALDYFEGIGKQITICRGSWSAPGSDNYDTFMAEYQKHQDIVRAAKATWSGRTFSYYGYDEIEIADITITPCQPLGLQIVADFSRP